MFFTAITNINAMPNIHSMNVKSSYGGAPFIRSTPNQNIIKLEKRKKTTIIPIRDFMADVSDLFNCMFFTNNP